MLVHNGNISNREGLKRLFECDIDERYSDTQILLSIINNMTQYWCKYCLYKTNDNSNYHKHLKTERHINYVNNDQSSNNNLSQN